jgi:integrase/recombinase XerD
MKIYYRRCNMLLPQGIKVCMEYHRSNSRDNTIRAYEYMLGRLSDRFEGCEMGSLSSEEMLVFLNQLCDGTKQSTKRSRYSTLRSFFNFIKNNIDHDFVNPCDTPMFKRIYRHPESSHWDIFEKEVIDEVIFRTMNPRNRLILELMARGGMRISEVLKLTPADVIDQKLILRNPKSGKENELVYIPEKLAERLKAYIAAKKIDTNRRIFPITYVAARALVHKAGELVGIYLRPHDLRRHAATYASRSGVPIEIVSKVILRHANLSTTQRYLGKVTDKEASRWINNLYG